MRLSQLCLLAGVDLVNAGIDSRYASVEVFRSHHPGARRLLRVSSSGAHTARLPSAIRADGCAGPCSPRTGSRRRPSPRVSPAHSPCRRRCGWAVPRAPRRSVCCSTRASAPALSPPWEVLSALATSGPGAVHVRHWACKLRARHGGYNRAQKQAGSHFADDAGLPDVAQQPAAETRGNENDDQLQQQRDRGHVVAARLSRPNEV